MIHDGETTDLDSFSAGLLVGILIGEGHFGGDGRQPHVSIRMHARHERLFRWLSEQIPGSRLYGPYHHGGRSYYQWMVRGAALREFLVPFLDGLPLSEVDSYAYERYMKMKADYRL